MNRYVYCEGDSENWMEREGDSLSLTIFERDRTQVYLASDIDPLIQAALLYVQNELADDSSQDDPSCALYPIIQALRALGLQVKPDR